MKRDEVFESLDPPAGGLARLRARLDRPRSAALRIAFVAVPAALAVAALLFLVLRPPRGPDLVSAARDQGGIDPAVLGLASPRSTVAVVDVSTSGIVGVETANPNVVFVWVASTQ